MSMWRPRFLKCMILVHKLQRMLNGFKIGGKTATGEKAEKGKYDKTKLISSFLSIFPIQNPKFISLVLFD